MRRLRLIAILAAFLAGCGGARHRVSSPHAQPVADAACSQPGYARFPACGEGVHEAARSAHVPAGGDRRRVPPPSPDALVTDENQNLLAMIDLRSRTARSFVGVPGGPQYVAARPGVALVTSPAAGAVTLLEGHPLRVVKVFHGFGAPHIIEISPDGAHAYVTDDARGTLTVIGLTSSVVTHPLDVGAHVHHMASSPDQRRLWIALGERASTIVIVDTSNVESPRVIGRFHPGFPAHDLAFSPDGRRVWISSASGPDVAVFHASDHRPLFRVRVGPPPQHIAFAGAYVYLTSGYASTIEQASTSTGQVIRRARSPYGSFELDVADGFLTTASLLNGKLAIYTPQLKLLHVIKLGPATRDVEISNP